MLTKHILFSVYKVIVEDFFDNYTTDSYIVRILETYKEGRWYLILIVFR